MNRNALVSALGASDIFFRGETDWCLLSDMPSNPDTPTPWKTLDDLTTEQRAAYDAELVAETRAAAKISRAAFLEACVVAGVIDEATAEEAASGAWPTQFNTFLAGLTVAQRIEAKAAWVDAPNGMIRRNSEVLAMIAADQGVSGSQLDAIFGIA